MSEYNNAITIEICKDSGIRLYRNKHGYVHCRHETDLIEVITSWGNKSYVCYKCGEVAKKDLTPTST